MIFAGAGFALMARKAAWTRHHSSPLSLWYPASRYVGPASREYFRIIDQAAASWEANGFLRRHGVEHKVLL